MPIYEYTCQDCQRDSELLIRGAGDEVCPHCGSPKLHKQLSVPAPPAGGKSGSSDPFPMASSGLRAGCGRPQCGGGHCQGFA